MTLSECVVVIHFIKKLGRKDTEQGWKLTRETARILCQTVLNAKLKDLADETMGDFKTRTSVMKKTNQKHAWRSMKHTSSVQIRESTAVVFVLLIWRF